MEYPVLAYKEKDDFKLYAFSDSRKLRHTSRELLKAGVFKDVLLIDSTGCQYKVENVREVGWANSFWGLSLTRKGRQIVIDFDLIFASKESIEKVKEFVLKRLEMSRNDALYNEISESVRKAESIDQIINFFL